MNCEGIEISPASSDDLRDILDLLSKVQLPHDGVAENVGGFLVARNEQLQLVGTIGLERYGNTALLRSARWHLNVKNQDLVHVLLKIYLSVRQVRAWKK